MKVSPLKKINSKERSRKSENFQNLLFNSLIRVCSEKENLFRENFVLIKKNAKKMQKNGNYEKKTPKISLKKTQFLIG